MEILEVTSLNYSEYFNKPTHVFNSAPFIEINSSKCARVFYLLFKDTKVRLGIVFGLRDQLLVSPFSAPFGGFESSSEAIKLQQIDAALASLITWASVKEVLGIRIVQPPLFYQPNFNAKLINCYFRAGFDVTSFDLNYHFSTAKMDENYLNTIWYNARKNYNRAVKSDLTFEKIANKNGKQAYDVIAQNRSERGFPLRLTWEQIAETISVVKADFFVVKKDQNAIAAAMIFYVSTTIVQVVYWGDLPQFLEFKTMNFLSFNVFSYYKQQGISIIDIGPSTDKSIPNFGLCEFKESIGCDLSIKNEYFKKLA